MEQNILEKILQGSMEPRDLPLELLREITDGFSADRIIGEGGFGTVYKGIVGNRNVAVKRIRSNMTIDDKLFLGEVNSLMEVNHKNVVRFLGFCSQTIKTPIENPEFQGYIFVEIRERLLCFDYINNGSLDTKITDELRGLEWDKRYKIIEGICSGLHYLHMEKCILHMDLKPANILLDNNLVPKIADFGLSRRLQENSQTISENIFFSLGYCAPENLFGGGRMSVQSDIYSLGVIIIEIVTGNKGIPNTNDNILRRWRHRWNKSKGTSLEYHEQVTKCIEIGSLCLKDDPYARPSISEIMRKFVELVNTDNCRTFSHDSVAGQPLYWEDDMLGVEPQDLHFANSGNNKHSILSCSVELTNDTNSFIAFNIQRTSPLPYFIEPNKGIVIPKTKRRVEITLAAENTQYHNNTRYKKEFIVRSLIVNEGLTVNDINEEVFDTHITGQHVDEIYLSVTSAEPCNKEFYQDYPGELIFTPKSSITSKPFSGHAEASSSAHTDSYSSATTEPMAMSFRELHRITDGFSEKRLLGTGGFGMVYKGVFDNGEVIAVKKLHNKPGLVEEQFKNELLNLVMVRHQNIIRLVGYCSEAKQIVDEHEGKMDLFYREERALCLEYLQGGNLEELLSDESCELDWEECYKIIKGICQGLKHLHTGSKEPIYHLDLKPANILLDRNRIPKIGDFGLSRLLASTETFVTKTYSGTTGYMPPEYMHRRQISSKFDVFSLGVIIIEIIAGHEGYYNYKCVMSPQEFINHVTENWSKRVHATEELLEVQRCIKIALRCVEDNQSKRPSITEIVEELNTISQHAPYDADAGDETTLTTLSI